MTPRVLFSARFVRDMRKLARDTPDLPAELLMQLAAVVRGEAPRQIGSVSAGGDCVHFYFRIGSRALARGKRGGYRVHAARYKEAVYFYCVYDHRKQDYLAAREVEQIKRAVLREAPEEVSSEWLTLEDFRREFGV
jgi:mRNA-degrading endonuclease RelE of RelBE toxin-antitoxin system